MDEKSGNKENGAQMKKIPVIDLFAGPGGLNCGFSEYRGSGVRFQIALSVEMDGTAYKTLLLRAFRRQFKKLPPLYYEYIRGGGAVAMDQLMARYPGKWARARDEVKQWELGAQPFDDVSGAIRKTLGHANPFWILLGGPPCQAYSVVGRSRMKNEKDFSSDRRHLLYLEYLKIVAVHEPSVFVMENVKGILSSKHGTRSGKGPIIRQIIDDLSAPAAALSSSPQMRGLLPKRPHSYSIHSFVVRAPDKGALRPRDFVIKSEDWGVPQRRHRVILLGIRDDVSAEPTVLRDHFDNESVNIEDVIGRMPKIRSWISKGLDSPKKWRAAVRGVLRKSVLKSISDPGIRKLLQKTASTMSVPRSTGRLFIPGKGKFRPQKLQKWLEDRRLGGVIQHDSRSHMDTDITRYFFMACASQAAAQKGSVKLDRFPRALLPAHKNLKGMKGRGKKGKKIDFADRFRVQVRGRQSTTVMSHISKDGHYYIHYDPKQCRSLTVREAARLQTFPDSYFFEGERTERFHQVGNAVPPLLALKLATVVAEIVSRADGVKA